MFTLNYNIFPVDINWFGYIINCTNINTAFGAWHYFLYFVQPFGNLENIYTKVDTETCYSTPVLRGGCYPFKTVDQMSLIFIYVYCNTFNRTISDTDDIQVCEYQFMNFQM